MVNIHYLMEKKILKWLLFFLFRSFFLPVSFSQIVFINEVCTSPPGASTVNANSLYNTDEFPSDNQEWIELYNPNPCNSIDISCFTLGGNMLQSTINGPVPNWGAFTFPAGTIIPPAGFIIVGGNHSQVPILEFNLTDYRQNTFGTQYLDGAYNRWFLRDEYGWVALYNASGSPVDAVYWDAYGNASNLNTAGEYQQNIVTTTSCSGTQSLSAARNIAGIEYLGACMPSSYLSFQRKTDGSSTWKTGPSTPTPHVCNGPCVEPPELSFVIQNEICSKGDGSISMTITDGHTGPYTTNWINPAGLHTNTLTNLSAGTYIVQVVDAYNCYIVYDTVTIINIPGPIIYIDSSQNEMCSASDGAIFTHVTGGTPPYTYLWNSSPVQQNQNLTGVHAGVYSVTMTDANGCKSYADTIITDTPPPSVVFDNILSDTCNKHSGAIHATAFGGHPPYSFVWSTSPTDNLTYISHLSEGVYTVSVTDSICLATASVYIGNIPGPKADFLFYPRIATIQNPTFRFEDWSTGNIDHWSWDFGDMSGSSHPNPVHTYHGIGTYEVMLRITNDYGCVDSITKQAIVIDKPALYIPNCFTPNGDGINDEFFVVGLNIGDLKFYLYDRWGELVYTSFNIDDRWNGNYKGRVLPDGIYNWVVFYNEDYAGVMVIPQTMKGLLTVLK